MPAPDPLTPPSSSAHEPRSPAEEIDPTGDSAEAHVASMVTARSRVLLLGSDGTALTESLRKRGCRVTAVETEAEAGARTSAWGERTVVADLGREDLEALVGKAQFDVLIARRVLEQVTDPVEVLRHASRLLTPRAVCLVAVTSATHAAVRLAVIDGRWPDRGAGLVDGARLRFFTRTGARRLLEAADFDVEETRTVERELTEAQVDFDRALLESPIAAYLMGMDDANVFELVLRGRLRGGGRPRPSAAPTRTGAYSDAQAREIRRLTLRARAAEETVKEQFRFSTEQARRIEELTARVGAMEEMVNEQLALSTEQARRIEDLTASEKELIEALRAARRRLKVLQHQHRELKRSRAVRAVTALRRLSRGYRSRTS